MFEMRTAGKGSCILVQRWPHLLVLVSFAPACAGISRHLIAFYSAFSLSYPPRGLAVWACLGVCLVVTRSRRC